MKRSRARRAPSVEKVIYSKCQVILSWTYRSPRHEHLRISSPVTGNYPAKSRLGEGEPIAAIADQQERRALTGKAPARQAPAWAPALESQVADRPRTIARSWPGHPVRRGQHRGVEDHQRRPGGSLGRQFSRASRSTTDRTLRRTGGRPERPWRDRRAQRRRTMSRCQRKTVPGVTMSRIAARRSIGSVPASSASHARSGHVSRE